MHKPSFAHTSICIGCHLPCGYLHRPSFAPAVICTGHHLPEASFAWPAICTGCHLPRPSFAQVIIFTGHHLHRSPFALAVICTGHLKDTVVELERNPIICTLRAICNGPTEQPQMQWRPWRAILRSNPGEESWRNTGGAIPDSNLGGRS